MSFTKVFCLFVLAACGTTATNAPTGSRQAAADPNVVVNPTGGNGTLLVTVPSLPAESAWVATTATAQSKAANSNPVAVTYGTA